MTEVDFPWQPWHPAELTDRLDGVTAPWCVTSGWAVDLFVGRQTREHDDLEIAVPQASWPQIRDALPDLEFVVAGDGQLWPMTDQTLLDHFQTWGRDATGNFRIDVFRDPHDGDTWICRRNPALTRPYTEVILRDADGVPYMAPEIVLLFKAKHIRDKDSADLRHCLPLMTADQRAWLLMAIDVVYPAPHPWSELVRAAE